VTEKKKREVPWLKKDSDSRLLATVSKVTDAMKAMELDIQRNDNIYPFNGGTVSQAEVCRRAGIKNALLQGAAHKTTTKVAVDKWVKDINAALITGRKNVRKAVTERADNWKEEHGKVTTSYRIDMLRLEMAQTRIAELTAENAALREQLAKNGSNVTSISPRRKKSDDS
jgi:hypothetical protein